MNPRFRETPGLGGRLPLDYSGAAHLLQVHGQPVVYRRDAIAETVLELAADFVYRAASVAQRPNGRSDFVEA